MLPLLPAVHSNFIFLKADFPNLYSLGAEAELLVHTDPAAALMKLRLFGEKLVDQLFAEHQLPALTENTQHRRLEELRRARLQSGAAAPVKGKRGRKAKAEPTPLFE
ncbi:hypothetical protein [Hymenobacter jejuensis]|uniref:Uncharacterized protein n=1 Tax=Hymenobacter jejuensis TaxID=2502781 RepID=A0A5B7ZW11_9BACT|nr:hypothetical protein [Hymenobacter jejuensis]QDA59027.1 hypothetical protein FHG12_02425 [Hymenobacter jejuensis]